MRYLVIISGFVVSLSSIVSFLSSLIDVYTGKSDLSVFIASILVVIFLPLGFTISKMGMAEDDPLEVLVHYTHAIAAPFILAGTYVIVCSAYINYHFEFFGNIDATLRAEYLSGSQVLTYFAGIISPFILYFVAFIFYVKSKPSINKNMIYVNIAPITLLIVWFSIDFIARGRLFSLFEDALREGGSLWVSLILSGVLTLLTFGVAITRMRESIDVHDPDERASHEQVEG